jgi:DNA-binding IclR family transcriptional regulator
MEDAVRQERTGEHRQRRLVMSVSHAFDLLDHLGEGNGSVGVSELARRTGLSKSTVHGLLATLEQRGAVQPDGDRGRYRLGWRLFELGSRVAEECDISRIAPGYLAHLARETGETALLGVLYDCEVLYLDVAHGTQAIQFAARVGRRGPLHATGTGKVLLAFGRPALLESVIAKGLERFTPTTICDPPALREETTAVRSRGYAIVREEREPGLSTVAVPVWDHTDRVAAAMALAGPSSRFDDARIEPLLAALTASAAAMSRELGY